MLITFIRNQIISRKIALTALSTICCSLATVYISINLILICIISRHLPMTNGYETMLLMAWIASIIALCLCRNRFSLLTSSAALIIIALCMVVAGISGNNPYITHLMPVLQSPLLCLHVLCIMIAYAILCIIVVISLSAIIIRIYSANDSSIISQLAIINRILLYPAVMLLSIGIFLGAVWASISWGRYWAWDPKEVWALITMVIYAMPIHSASLSQFGKPMFLHIYLVAAIISVVITYFGVNMFLGGMHSYA